MITYDADTSRWVDLNTDSNGGYDLSTSKGWVGDKMVWHDLAFAPGPDVTAVTDQTMTKVSDTKFSFASGFTEKSGRKVTFKGACTKKS